MIKTSGRAVAALFAAAALAGCATHGAFAPSAKGGSQHFVRHAADVLANGVNYTRSSSREVAGWCWNDKATGRLAYVSQAHVGEYEGVGVTLRGDPGGANYVSCSWHTHPWGRHVAPGPSRQDLRNSMLPWTSGITHFVVDQHGIWQYGQGRVVEMCPWNGNGTGFEMARCRP
jgi:hypothetical protein